MPRVKKEILPPEHATDIKSYEKSSYWIKFSKMLLEDKECKCEICGRSRWKWQTRNKVWKRAITFNVHHKHYRTVCKEQRSDIMVLCISCHDLGHLLLRLRKWGGVFEKLASVFETVFMYEGASTFTPF